MELSAPSHPVVTVLTVCWNVVKWIDACAESVLQQDGPALEWLVVDNGSSDGTRERLQSWAKRDRRVRLEALNENRRQPGGYGHALPLVRGRYVAHIDGDDVMLPGHVSQAVDWLASASGSGAVYGEAEFINAEGQLLAPWFIARDAEALRRLAEFTMPAIHSTGVWTTEMLRRCFAPIADEGFAYDYYLLTRALEEGAVGWLPQPQVAYRIHPANESHRKPLAQLAYGMAYSLSAARRRVGRSVDIKTVLAWSDACQGTAEDEADVYRSAATMAWQLRVPRHAVYYGRRALKRGRWSVVPLLARVIWTERRSTSELWPLCRGGLLAAARVDGRGHSLTPA